MYKARILVIFFTLGIALKSSGQGLWTSIAAEKSITKKFTLDANIQARFDDFNTINKSWIGELGISYDLPKGFDLSATYRLRNKINEDDDEIETKLYHRWNADLKYKTKIIKPLQLNYRLRFQQRFKQDTEDGLVPDDNQLRNRLGLTYKNKSKHSPYIGAEVFYLTGDSFNKFRYNIGTDYKLNKKQKFNFGVSADKAINSSNAVEWRAIIGYKIKL